MTDIRIIRFVLARKKRLVVVAASLCTLVFGIGPSLSAQQTSPALSITSPSNGAGSTERSNCFHFSHHIGEFFGGSGDWPEHRTFVGCKQSTLHVLLDNTERHFRTKNDFRSWSYCIRSNDFFTISHH